MAGASPLSSVSRRRPAGIFAGTLILLHLVGATANAAETGWRQDGAGFEDVPDPARELFALPEPLAAFAEHAASPEEILDTVLTVVHDVPIRDEETLRVRESFSLRSWLRRPRRATLFLTNTAATAALYRIPVEGYDGPAMAARRGFFAFTVDYIGVGDNYRPGLDALESTFERNLEALKKVVRYIRYVRAVPAVDLVGESWGAAHATQLAADAERIRSCVMSSVSYKATNPMFLSPEFVAMLKSLPDNYLPPNAELLVSLAHGAPEAVKDFIRETQTYPVLTTQLWQFQEGLPHFDPSVAKVPGLVIASGPPETEDHKAFADDYGSAGAEYFEMPTAGHAPRLESPETAAAFWSRVFEFLDGSE